LQVYRVRLHFSRFLRNHPLEQAHPKWQRSIRELPFLVPCCVAVQMKIINFHGLFDLFHIKMWKMIN
jgi:hypothetical protein